MFNFTEMSTFAVLVESLLTSLAILAGGAWAYFKFFKGRTFRERLEIQVTAKMQNINEKRIVVASLKVSNIGFAKIPIEEKGTGLNVLICDFGEADYNWAKGGKWNDVATVSVLRGHSWIEPGESIIDQQIFLLPSTPTEAIKFTLQVVSKKQSWTAVFISVVDQNQTEVESDGSLRRQ